MKFVLLFFGPPFTSLFCDRFLFSPKSPFLFFFSGELVVLYDPKSIRWRFYFFLQWDTPCLEYSGHPNKNFLFFFLPLPLKQDVVFFAFLWDIFVACWDLLSSIFVVGSLFAEFPPCFFLS